MSMGCCRSRWNLLLCLCPCAAEAPLQEQQRLWRHLLWPSQRTQQLRPPLPPHCYCCCWSHWSCCWNLCHRQSCCHQSCRHHHRQSCPHHRRQSCRRHLSCCRCCYCRCPQPALQASQARVLRAVACGASPACSPQPHPQQPAAPSCRMMPTPSGGASASEALGFLWTALEDARGTPPQPRQRLPRRADWAPPRRHRPRAARRWAGSGAGRSRGCSVADQLEPVDSCAGRTPRLCGACGTAPAVSTDTCQHSRVQSQQMAWRAEGEGENGG